MWTKRSLSQRLQNPLKEEESSPKGWVLWIGVGRLDNSTFERTIGTTSFGSPGTTTTKKTVPSKSLGRSPFCNARILRSSLQNQKAKPEILRRLIYLRIF